MLHLKDLFTTRIYYKLLSERSDLPTLIRELKEECYQLVDADAEGYAWSEKNYPFGYTSYGSALSGYDRLHRFSSTFEHLKRYLDQHVKSYVKSLEMEITASDLEMTHCWVNVMGPQARHPSHNHPLSVISGTFYIHVPRGAGALRFEDPRQGLFMNSPGIRATAQVKNKRTVDLQPGTGYVVLFESWLKHEVPAAKIRGERVSVSFNYGWKNK